MSRCASALLASRTTSAYEPSAQQHAAYERKMQRAHAENGALCSARLGRVALEEMRGASSVTTHWEV